MPGAQELLKLQGNVEQITGPLAARHNKRIDNTTFNTLVICEDSCRNSEGKRPVYYYHVLRPSPKNLSISFLGKVMHTKEKVASRRHNNNNSCIWVGRIQLQRVFSSQVF